MVRPDPHPALRATFPEGEGFYGANLSVFAGKIQENRSGFLGRFKRVWRKIEIPVCFVFLLQPLAISLSIC